MSISSTLATSSIHCIRDATKICFFLQMAAWYTSCSPVSTVVFHFFLIARWHQVNTEGVTLAVNMWWPSAVSIAFERGGHMASYYARKAVCILVEQEKVLYWMLFYSWGVEVGTAELLVCVIWNGYKCISSYIWKIHEWIWLFLLKYTRCMSGWRWSYRHWVTTSFEERSVSIIMIVILSWYLKWQWWLW